MNVNRTVKVGIMPLSNFKEYTMAIARGLYKPKKDEPKIWFNSMRSLANILSEENQALLKLIIDLQPQSISELEKVTGRKSNNILRTLRTMEHLGFVKLEEGKGHQGRSPLKPFVIYDSAKVVVNFANSKNYHYKNKPLRKRA